MEYSAYRKRAKQLIRVFLNLVLAQFRSTVAIYLRHDFSYLSAMSSTVSLPSEIIPTDLAMALAVIG